MRRFSPKILLNHKKITLILKNTFFKFLFSTDSCLSTYNFLNDFASCLTSCLAVGQATRWPLSAAVELSPSAMCGLGAVRPAAAGVSRTGPILHIIKVCHFHMHLHKTCLKKQKCVAFDVFFRSDYESAVRTTP